MSTKKHPSGIYNRLEGWRGLGRRPAYDAQDVACRDQLITGNGELSLQLLDRLTTIFERRYRVFSFMTTLPNALTSTINHERSPVLLTTEAEYGAWLTGTPEEAFGLIKPSDPERMSIVQSGFDKEDLLALA